MAHNAGYLRPFLHGSAFLYGVGDDPRTLSELAMLEFSANLRSRPGWWTEHRNQGVRRQWLEEALAKSWEVGPPSNKLAVKLTKEQIDYTLDELAGYAALRDESNGAQISCFDRIWESDSLTTSTELSDLFGAIRQLRTDNELTSSSSSKTTLADPYRHGLIYGRTYTYPPSLEPPFPIGDYCVSSKFAALPTDLIVSPASYSVKCLSYINGIDPVLQDVYNSLEVILGTFISLFEHVLTDLHRNNPLPHRIKGTCRYKEWDEPDPPEHSDDDEGWHQFHRELEHWELNRPIQIPDVPKSGYPGDLPRRNYEVNLRGRRIQVLFKVTDFHLTPDDPQIPETDWHVEGMKNERIVACGLYFCSVENIVDAKIAFRMAVTSPRGFSAGDVGATYRTWGMRDGDACNQLLGSVTIRAGLGIAFPNIYQHRMTAMRLAEPSQTGRFTALSFFLVDPDAPPIISTAHVPPQQPAWIHRALETSLDKRLPTELIERIMSHVDWLLSPEEADGYALEMRKERELFYKLNDDNYFSLPFDIWSGD